MVSNSRIKIQSVSKPKTRRPSSKKASNELMKKSLKGSLVLKDGFNMRTVLTPCKYKEDGCPYVDTSLKTTRQALKRHELRCPVLKVLDFQKWFDGHRFMCACKEDFDKSYYSKHYPRCTPAKNDTKFNAPKQHINSKPRASKATTQHSIMFLHFTCTASKEIKYQRLRSFFKSVPDDKYNKWYELNVASKSEQDITAFVNTARSFPYINKLDQAHSNNHKYPFTNKYCSRAEEYLYSNVQKMGLFIIDNLIDTVIDVIDHAEELINSQNNEVELEVEVETDSETDEVTEEELEAVYRDIHIIKNQNEFNDFNDNALKDEMEFNKFIEFNESEIQMLNTY